MAVRNWWIDADIDGRKTELSGGPRSKSDGFNLRVYQRDEGSVVQVLYIYGLVDNEGNLVLRGNFRGEPLEFVTKR